MIFLNFLSLIFVYFLCIDTTANGHVLPSPRRVYNTYENKFYTQNLNLKAHVVLMPDQIEWAESLTLNTTSILQTLRIMLAANFKPYFNIDFKVVQVKFVYHKTAVDLNEENSIINLCDELTSSSNKDVNIIYIFMPSLEGAHGPRILGQSNLENCQIIDANAEFDYCAFVSLHETEHTIFNSLHIQSCNGNTTVLQRSLRDNG